MGLEDHNLIATDEQQDFILMLFSFLQDPNFGIFVRQGTSAVLPTPMQGRASKRYYDKR
jgi:hypothetical protein